ncbi:MAG: glycosyltransferase family 4 protein [Armatimonadetes bacterium]|nr:glycosyltransferase family 4 protein [Armatimonadota bacterium]
MKICLITEYFYPDNTGGTPTGLSELSRYFKDNYPDIELDVITSSNMYRLSPEKLAPFEDWDGVRIHRVGCPRSNRPSTALRILAGLCFTFAARKKLMKMGPHDLVFVGTNPPSAPIAALAYKRRSGTPYVYLIHDFYPDLAVALGAVSKTSYPARLARKHQKRWLGSADMVAVLGRCMKTNLETAYGIPGEQIEVITNWADPQQIYPMPKTSRFREKHHLSGFIALYAGNLGPFQGLDVILDAAKIAKEKNSDATFLLVGKGTRWDEIAERIEREGLTNVRLLPAVGADEYPDLLASADVCLVPLAPGIDGLAVPSKFYTILAAGRPTVAILDPNSEISRAVVESDCGMQVNQGDPASLADAVVKLRNDSDLAEQMGQNARKALEENYTIKHIADRFHNLFGRVIASRGAAK